MVYPDHLPRLSAQELLPPLNPWLRWGGLTLGGTAIAAFLLSAVIPYPVTVTAPATIRPVGELRLVEAPRAGIVREIVVGEHQEVVAGEIIARLDDTPLKIQQGQIQGLIDRLDQQLAQMTVQITAMDRQRVAEEEGGQRAIASARAEWVGQEQDYRDRQQNNQQDLAIAHTNRRQAEAELKSAQANLETVEASLQAARAQQQRYEPIAQKGAISQDQWAQVQLSVIEQEQARVRAQQEVEARLQGIQATQATLEKAQNGLTLNKSEVLISEQRFAQQQATREATLARLQQEREALTSQHIELQKQRDHEQRELDQLEQELQHTLITAPISGTILKLNLRNPNQSLQPGQEIAQISPQFMPLIIEARIPSADIQGLAVGQTAQTRISACPYPDYGILIGQVQSISTDTLHPPGVVQSFYKVTIQPETPHFGRVGRSCVLQAGMEGRTDILGASETLLQWILRKVRLSTNL
ncbi:HlyD family efflux transporter periplasmic adaptor subunit [Spirulina sp. CCNP1310]|uniref:HlyD family efflux transporter periplasmic adaptor subunit n=1 Tax=Spirulina sp. CCNP1310 TaxID=3110249 RepID=UPI002B207333|nr:HlyD family efflux transporter periplasmic adaptor subunit [Spirulina sp. CCNP1310]MEA5420213.1 HlyD family efflux transporter periplasmic adaptor subunit [Spirulina sp. CCNP1310]